jgi:hypothetical protein
VAVRGVRIKGDVGKQGKVGEIFFQGAKSSWDEAFWVVGGTGVGCTEVLVKTRKEGDASDAAPSEAGCLSS